MNKTEDNLFKDKKKKREVGICVLLSFFSIVVFFLQSPKIRAGLNTDYVELKVTSNAAPAASNVQLNDGDDIVLTAGTTKQVSVTSTVSDDDGCDDISTVLSNIYYSSAGSDCSADDNTCYASISCTVNDCGGGDTSATATCSTGLYFHATSGTWEASVSVTDASSETGSAVSNTRTVGELQAMDVSSPIAYGVVDPEDDNTTSSSITNWGNVAIDSSLRGIDMTSSLSGGAISVTKQKYDTSEDTYTNLGATLSSTDASFFVDLGKPTANPSDSTDVVWWGLEVPSGTPDADDYSGTNYFTAAEK